MNMNDINQIYQNLFGFIPAPTEARHEVTLQVRVEELELHEMFRKIAWNQSIFQKNMYK